MTHRIYCSLSTNRSVHRCNLTYHMKTLTYLLTAFSCGYTAQCLAGLAGLAPGPFFLIGFACAVLTLKAYR